MSGFAPGVLRMEEMSNDFRYNQLKELRCDNCREVMGAVYENDLNGTIILCIKCGMNRTKK